MPFNCSIDLDDDWIQEGCHWKCERSIIFTWEASGSPSDVELYYRFNTLTSDTTKYKRVYLSPKTINGKSRYTLNLKLSSLTAAEQKELHESGYITIYAKNGSGETGYKTIEYDLVLPPKFGEGDLLIKRKTSKKFLCQWPEAKEAIPTEGDTTGTGISGYSIELERCPKKSEVFSQVHGIAVGTRTNATTGQTEYWIENVGTPGYSIIPVTEEILEGDFTLGSNIGNSEVYVPYIDDNELPKVYFNPKDFGFGTRDRFRFKVSPYVVYSNYYDEEQQKVIPSALLASDPVLSDPNKYAGLVWVKTDDKVNNGWKEGLVWVKTATGWREASSIHIKSSNGWK